MHDSVRVVSTVGVGKADVQISFDAWKDGHVTPTKHVVDVVVPRPGPKPEPVSPRLKAELIHPNKTGHLVGLAWSPDGKRIVAGDYPGGIVQFWDAATGEQLTRIDTGYGYRGSGDYIRLTPDWKTVFVSRSNRKHSRVEKDGKQLTRWEFNGDVRAWDVDTGQLRVTYRHSPPRNIVHMVLSPTGETFVTTDEVGGDYERSAPHVMSLWNPKTAEHRPICSELGSYGAYVRYSPDGTMFTVEVGNEDHYSTALKVFDVASARETAFIPITSKFASAGATSFLSDQRLLLGYERVYPGKGRWDSPETSLKIWDVQTGSEVASIKPSNSKTMAWSVLSPHKRLLVNTNWKEAEGKLVLIDLATRQETATISLGANATPMRPEFSPDGRWIAVATRVIPADLKEDTTPDEVPQPRIHLIEVATAAVREVIVMPYAFVGSVAFSPDGKTLATDGYGRVILWDMTKPPGE